MKVRSLALAGEEARPGAAPARGRAVTSPAGLRARRCGRSSQPRRLAAGVGSAGLDWRGGEAGGCGFPRLGFPPGAPLSEAPPSFCGSSAGGQTHPRSLALARSLGATARRPFSFVWAAALRVPPPEIPRRSLNTPVPPQSCGGRSRVRRRSASRTAPALPWSPRVSAMCRRRAWSSRLSCPRSGKTGLFRRRATW